MELFKKTSCILEQWNFLSSQNKKNFLEKFILGNSLKESYISRRNL